MKTILLIIITALGSILPKEKAVIAKYNVSGTCNMCKTKIEKAALEAGVENAFWNPDKGVLKVKFLASKTNKENILKAVANTGYDNELYKAEDATYTKLDSCCKYREKNKKCEK